MASFFRGIFQSASSTLGNVMVSTSQFALQSIRGMANHKHKKILKLTKGFRGRANRCYTVAYHRALKAQQYAYRDRKVIIFCFFFFILCLIFLVLVFLGHYFS